ERSWCVLSHSPSPSCCHTAKGKNSPAASASANLGAAAFSGGSFGSGGFQGGNVGILSYDEKLTMQSLNERLASYMETVRNLEKENAHLEQLIREWYQKQGPIGPKDYSHYYEKIEELQKQIVAAAVETHKVLLELDNTKMTAEDFRIKYEMESGLRQNVEGDLNSLRPMLDNLTLAKSDLEMQFESLKEEIIDLKKNHEEVRASSLKCTLEMPL
uniref:IF rod domain-containing protein n=1 Tax=Junco hyemalis TaxID=40217 RepID=A0A8C5JLF1_JUNHY